MLEAIIYKRGYTIKTFANALGVSEKTLINKLNRKSEFKVGEVLKIIFLLNLDYNEVSVIFFK